MNFYLKSILSLACIVSSNTIFAACTITGCSGELCMEEAASNFSICLWKAEYECYQQYGICEANINGKCGWRQTEELLNCIKEAQKLVSRADPFPD